MKKVLVIISILIGFCFVCTWYLLNVKKNEDFPLVDPGIDFRIDEGIRIDWASNPRIMDYEAGVITLAYEYRAQDLQNEPGQKG